MPKEMVSGTYRYSAPGGAREAVREGKLVRIRFLHTSTLLHNQLQIRANIFKQLKRAPSIAKAKMSQIRNEALLKEIAKKVKALREKDKRGLTQEAFYNDTGIHIGRIESGAANISVSTLEAVCRYFGLTLEQFFKGM